MSGTIDIDAPGLSLSEDRMPIFVFRYTPGEEEPYRLIPRFQCVKVEYKEGGEPPTAQFVYVQDDSDPLQDENIPTQFEDYWPSSTKDADHRVLPDDRIVVLAVVDWEETENVNTGEITSTPVTRVLFDGFPRMPQTDVDPSSQAVSVLAVSVALRCWDSPIKGVIMRDADDPTAGEAIWAQLPTRFNPDGKPNCVISEGDYSPEIAETTDLYGEEDFPIFLDPGFTRDKKKIEYWTLDKAAKYLLAVWNGKAEYVENPDFSTLESLLRNRKPKEGLAFFDPADPESYDEKPIVLRDVDVSGHAWPQALSRILGYGGFGMRFVTEDDENGEPWNYLEIYRKDNDGPTDPKEINFPRAARLDEEPVDVQNLHIAHDYHSVFNQILIETKPLRAEIALVLAPGYEPNPADGNGSSRDQFKRGNLDAHPDLRNKYRLYVADECGDGHWDMAAKEWSVEPMDFEPIFPKNSHGDRTYVRRYRPGSTEIHTKDAGGKPIKTQIAVSRDYTGPPPPCIWDGTGTWQVIQGGFEILKDRLGIWVSQNDPGQWDIGEPSDPAHAQEPSRILDGITGQAHMGDAVFPTQRAKRFHLRMVTTIEADFDITVYAGRRESCPVKAVVSRVVDCRDHFTRKAILKSSPFYKRPDGGEEGDPSYALDQTELAQTHADQLRSAHDYPPVAGAIVIPQITFAYQVGDRLSKINGRDVSLRANAAQEQREAPIYPFLVSISWQFTPDRQSTTLQFTDRRAEPQRVTGKSRA